MNVLVTGLHRCGTNNLEDLLEVSNHSRGLLHELLNKQFSVSVFDKRYPNVLDLKRVIDHLVKDIVPLEIKEKIITMVQG